MADDQRTHGENCYLWDRHHYDCALREIERLRAEVARVKRLYADCDFCLGNALKRAESAERELAALRERIEKAPVYDVPKNAPSTKVQFAEAIASVRVLTELRGKRVRLVVEE